jgi:ABC-type dipeptide/oligopeptide/nickel transport system permease component/ABC-type transport system substrate-binding protein
VLYLLAAAGFASVLAGMAWLMRPDMSQPPPSHSPAELAAVEAGRRMDIDPNHPLVIHRDVDYSQGPNAPWWPRHQSPILDKLVASGELPPVAERTGPEPEVVEGVEGVGKFGGTWVRAGNSTGDIFGVMTARMSGPLLVRWSPHGLPVTPHLAKSFTISPDSRTFTFTLRKGMRWSDGQPFTTDDIMYWWEHEATDPNLSPDAPAIMMVHGQRGDIEKVDDLSFRVKFPLPNGLFLLKLATIEGTQFCESPAHYLRQFHPALGAPDFLDAAMKSLKVMNHLSVYRQISGADNPQHPRMWPWVFHTFKPNPPYSFVRNPYYPMVDTRGNQLPYVDRIFFEQKSGQMIVNTASAGGITMQARHIPYDQYTLLMSERRDTTLSGQVRSVYDVRHWYPGESSTFVISVNFNLKVAPDRPDSANKAALLGDKRFRQALSLAIDRKVIIEAEFNNQTRPSQCAPGPESYYYYPKLFSAYTRYDPNRANRMLDEIGLTRRDSEGYRTFADGARMQFYLNISDSGLSPLGPAQFVVDDWNAVGVRTVLRLRARGLFYTEKAALLHDFNVWTSNGEFMPLISPRYFVPNDGDYALAYGTWYARGGLYGNPRAKMPGAMEPPKGSPLRRTMEIYEQARAAADPAEQRRIFNQAMDLAAENLWSINICTAPPILVVVKHGFRNVPKTAVYDWDFLSPSNAAIETYFWDEDTDTPETRDDIARQIATVTPADDAPGAASPGALAGPAAAPAARPAGGDWVRTLLRTAIIVCGLLVALLVTVRHPYIGRRLLIMVPTLLVISVIVFTIIQLPPGDYVTTRIMLLQESGDTAQLRQLKDLREMFYLDEPMPVRYARWLGLPWFASLHFGGDFPFIHGNENLEGLLQGNLGRSMEDSKPVNQIVGDRIALTFLISLGTVLFTWLLAIPTGIFSAVKQYSVGDYIVTLIGFVGMCVPSFLLALLLAYLSKRFFHFDASALLSPEYATQVGWTWPKFLDLLKHIWVPVTILGIGGTAGMIRVMRGNLLDELRKPYVTTARAKGVRPTKLLLKYPVRLALNPFISGIGGIFPGLISGGSLVAVVLSIATVGPLMLQALMNEDMYLAGSMLMVLSALSVFGTLVSDLLLLALDPRIRYQKGTR